MGVDNSAHRSLDPRKRMLRRSGNFVPEVNNAKGTLKKLSKAQTRAASAPIQREGCHKRRKRNSERRFTTQSKSCRAEDLQKDWSRLQEDVLMVVVQKLSPLTASKMRLVCKSWKEAVEKGLIKLQSDTAWDMDQLDKVQQTFPHLESMDLQACGCWTRTLKPLHRMTNLRHLRLCRLNSLPPAKWTSTFAKLRQLKSLALPWCGMLQLNLSGFRHLQQLDLTSCFMLNGFALQTELPSLKCLNLRECQRIRDWSFLLQMPKLEALDLSYCCQVGDEQMNLLASLKSLNLLVLMHCRNVTAVGLHLLAASKSLRNVYIDGCPIGDNYIWQVMRLASHMNVIKFSL